MGRTLFSLFFLFFITILLSCSRESKVSICKESDCSYSLYPDRFIKISVEDRDKWYIIGKDGLSELSYIFDSTVPLYYNERKKELLAKTLTEAGIRLTLFDGAGSTAKKISDFIMPQSVVLIISACIDSKGRVWVLFMDDDDDNMRKYIVSATDPKFKDWDSYMLLNENANNTLADYAENGESFEKPVALTCGENGDVYITTFLYYGSIIRSKSAKPKQSDFIQANVYEFNKEKKALEHLTNYFPIKDGMASIGFDTKNRQLLVFQDQTLIKQQSLGFPVERKFPDKGDMLIFPILGKTSYFLVPEVNEKSGSKKIDGKLFED